MKYKVGDRVVVRRDLKVENKYGNISVSVDMVGLNGKLATIIKVYPSSYLINLDNGCWCWTSEMFESSSSNKLFPLL